MSIRYSSTDWFWRINTDEHFWRVDHAPCKIGLSTSGNFMTTWVKVLLFLLLPPTPWLAWINFFFCHFCQHCNVCPVEQSTYVIYFYLIILFQSDIVLGTLPKYILAMWNDECRDAEKKVGKCRKPEDLIVDKISIRNSDRAKISVITPTGVGHCLAANSCQTLSSISNFF